jgi:hypothetical protein
MELTSKWDSLNKNLLASFYEVDNHGKPVEDGVTVVAPLINGGAFEVMLNWQSPFENIGQSSLPTFQQMIQTGQLEPLARMVDESLNSNLSNQSKQLEGKTSITKLNSIQVFAGMPPCKLNVTAFFRAWDDPVSEVETPFRQLMDWSLPKHLDDNGFIVNVKEKGLGKDTALPSQIPSFIAMRYKGMTYSPMVIESISQPLDASIDNNGNYIEMSIQLSLATLTAIDRNDYKNFSL